MLAHRRKWNWKAVGSSALVRGHVVLTANLHAGALPALRVLVVELLVVGFGHLVRK